MKSSFLTACFAAIILTGCGTVLGQRDPGGVPVTDTDYAIDAHKACADIPRTGCVTDGRGFRIETTPEGATPTRTAPQGGNPGYQAYQSWAPPIVAITPPMVAPCYYSPFGGSMCRWGYRSPAYGYGRPYYGRGYNRGYGRSYGRAPRYRRW